MEQREVTHPTRKQVLVVQGAVGGNTRRGHLGMSDYILKDQIK